MQRSAKASSSSVNSGARYDDASSARFHRAAFSALVLAIRVFSTPSRQFRSAYGESPYSYLMTRRIERAMALLRRGDLSVTEVCFEVGCSSLGTFSTRFTELVGVPPSVYRRDAAQATEGLPSCVEKQVTRPVRNRETSDSAA